MRHTKAATLVPRAPSANITYLITTLELIARQTHKSTEYFLTDDADLATEH